MNTVEFKNQLTEILRQIKLNMGQILNAVYEENGMTTLQASVLRQLLQCGAQTIGELGKSLQIVGSNISALCKKLEQQGYLHRKRDQQDERIVWVSLSTLGKEKIISAEQKVQALYHQAGQNLSEEDLSVLLQGIEKLNTFLSAMARAGQEKGA